MLAADAMAQRKRVSSARRAAPPPAATLHPADLNRDNRVDATDVRMFLLVLTTGVGACPSCQSADVNRDAQVNDRDLAAITQAANDYARANGGTGGAAARFTARVAQTARGQALEMTDQASGALLLRPNGQPLWGPVSGARNPALPPSSITVTPVADGFDIVYQFHNATTAARSPGALFVPGFRLGGRVFNRDFRLDGKMQTIDNAGRAYYLGGYGYPSNLYAPVMVFGNSDYTVGVTLHYPVLDYKHEVFMRLETPGGEFMQTGANWQTLIELNPVSVASAPYSPAGDIRPGERRTYTVTVRVQRSSANEWTALLQPYKDFFARTYGGLRYTRDDRPVACVTIAQPHMISASNRYGFEYPETRRPDRFGFGPWASEMLQIRQRGWERQTVWTPTGMYFNHRNNNYPFQFTSHWTEGQRFGHRMGDAVTQFRRVANAGVSLGLWWGYSAHVMTGWDTPTFQVLNPANQAHVNAALREFDLAVQAGATMIGLDTITSMPVWERYPWVQRLQQRAPHVKFVTEPYNCDVMHTLGPTFYPGNRPPEERAMEMDNRHYLADFLLPGHETWVFVRSDFLRDQRTGLFPSDQRLLQEAQRFADNGYVAVVTTSTAVLDRPLRAARSWEQQQQPR